MRYRRQGYELNVAWDAQSPQSAIEAFHQLHQQRYGFCDAERPVEIVNLRLRMVAAGEPYAPARRELVPGDGSAACYAERKVYFDGRFMRSRFYRRDGLRSGRCGLRAGDDYRIHGGHGASAGRDGTGGWLWKSRDCS